MVGKPPLNMIKARLELLSLFPSNWSAMSPSWLAGASKTQGNAKPQSQLLVGGNGYIKIQ